MNHFDIRILIIIPNINTYVIGMVGEIGHAQSQSGSKKLQVNLVLKDFWYVMLQLNINFVFFSYFYFNYYVFCIHFTTRGNNTINYTLWEAYASQFFTYKQKKTYVSLPTIIVLQYAKVKEEGCYIYDDGIHFPFLNVVGIYNHVNF